MKQYQVEYCIKVGFTYYVNAESKQQAMQQGYDLCIAEVFGTKNKEGVNLNDFVSNKNVEFVSIMQGGENE